MSNNKKIDVLYLEVQSVWNPRIPDITSKPQFNLDPSLKKSTHENYKNLKFR